jgi:hypothetical protein
MLGISSNILGYILFIIFPVLIFCLWTFDWITIFLKLGMGLFSIQSSIIAVKLIISLGFLSLALLFVLRIERSRFKIPIFISRIRKCREELRKIQIEKLSIDNKKNKLFDVLKKLEREHDFSSYYALNFDKMNYDFNNEKSLDDACSQLVKIIDKYIDANGAIYQLSKNNGQKTR